MKIISYLSRMPGKGPLRELSYFRIPWSWERKKGLEKTPEQQRAEQSHGIFSSIFGKAKKTPTKHVNVPRG